MSQYGNYKTALSYKKYNWLKKIKSFIIEEILYRALIFGIIIFLFWMFSDYLIPFYKGYFKFFYDYGTK